MRATANFPILNSGYLRFRLLAGSFAGYSTAQQVKRPPRRTLSPSVSPNPGSAGRAIARRLGTVIPAWMPESSAMDGHLPGAQVLDLGSVQARGLPSLDAGFRHPCRNDGDLTARLPWERGPLARLRERRPRSRHDKPTTLPRPRQFRETFGLHPSAIIDEIGFGQRVVFERRFDGAGQGVDQDAVGRGVQAAGAVAHEIRLVG